MLAQRLPVGLAPEKILVATMRRDMVNNTGSSRATYLGTVGAQRIVVQEPLASLLPAVVVATLRAGHAAAPAAWRDGLDEAAGSFTELRANGLESGHSNISLPVGGRTYHRTGTQQLSE